MADWKSIFELSDIRILLYLRERRVARYSELLDRVIHSRSTLANSLRQLQESGLVDRRVKAARPVQTEYLLTERGERFTQLLIEMMRLVSGEVV